LTYDFNKIIDRTNTDCIKYDFACRYGKPAGVLPLWVADMDFPTPPEVREALTEQCRHGIFGYSETRRDYFTAIASWMSQSFGWQIHEEWLAKTPSVVYAIAAAIRALTEEGDAILIQQPVYHPFASTVLSNRRHLVVNELALDNGRYSMDIDDFKQKIVREKVKMFILCSPHNPVGRVWTKEELRAVGDICLEHGVLVVADEVHHDFIYPGRRHTIFAALDPALANITVTCTAPSKTFNLAGLQIANIFISSRTLREAFQEEMKSGGYSNPNIMGLVACRAAYTYGRPWLTELLAYLAGNLSLIRDFLAQELPAIRLIEPEGTYLVWLDFRELGLADARLDDLLVHKAGLWLDAGTMFGVGGSGFARINIACPRATLKKALTALKLALS